MIMHWYNPKTRQEEEVAVPLSEAQAIEMLSGHPDSDLFIEEYCLLRESQPHIVEALVFTGEAFYWEHSRGQPPELEERFLPGTSPPVRSQPRAPLRALWGCCLR
jgi:hypothetical protein